VITIISSNAGNFILLCSIIRAGALNVMAKAQTPKWTETFREGVAEIMGQWKGLQMAVDHQFGGADSKEKGTWLMEVTGNFMLENGKMMRKPSVKSRDPLSSEANLPIVPIIVQVKHLYFIVLCQHFSIMKLSQHS